LAEQLILVVDDYHDLREGLVDVLKAAGYRVIGAGSAAAAIAAAGNDLGQVSLLLTDISLPDMLGTELAKQLVALHPQMRVLVMSGSAGLPPGTVPAQGNPPRFIQKPFMFPDLVQVVRELLAAGEGSS
jgi:DNA-binding NtrC family response regulator